MKSIIFGNNYYTLMSEYKFERVDRGHFELLKVLYTDAFAININIAEIEKRHSTKALGRPHVGFIAIHQASGAPAAYYGVFPVQLIEGARTIMAAQSADTMTHRDHRKKGLFIQLAKLTYEACANENIKLVFGFPNDNSYPGFINKLNWQPIDQVIRWDLKLKFKTIPFPKLSLRNRRVSNFYTRYARMILKRFLVPTPESFLNQYAGGYARVLRDRSYIDYKESRDKMFIKVNELILWIKLSDTLWIGDIDNYDKVSGSFLRKIRQIARRLGYNTISFHLNESVPLPEFLKDFKKQGADSSCICYIDAQEKPTDILFTGADFDTW